MELGSLGVLGDEDVSPSLSTGCAQPRKKIKKKPQIEI